jgi:hypothetical protein
VLLPKENNQEAINILQHAIEINRRAHVDANNTAEAALQRLQKQTSK